MNGGRCMLHQSVSEVRELRDVPCKYDGGARNGFLGSPADLTDDTSFSSLRACRHRTVGLVKPQSPGAVSEN